jgi:hypothetical protein
MPDRPQFRPSLGFRRTLPAAIFLSLITTAFLSPLLQTVPLPSFTYGMLDSTGGRWAIFSSGAMSLMSSPLAVLYSIQTRGHDRLRWTFLLFNALVCIAWFGILGAQAIANLFR